jgi:hypothetical protein
MGIPHWIVTKSLLGFGAILSVLGIVFLLMSHSLFYSTILAVGVGLLLLGMFLRFRYWKNQLEYN